MATDPTDSTLSNSAVDLQILWRLPQDEQSHLLPQASSLSSPSSLARSPTPPPRFFGGRRGRCDDDRQDGPTLGQRWLKDSFRNERV
jgi:hypothetical protein